MRRTAIHTVFTLWMLAGGCARGPAAEAPALVGAWRSAIRFRTGAFASIPDLEFMYVFNAGGTLTESSNYDGAPPVPPAYGVWRSVGPNQFEAKYEFFTTAPPANLDTLRSGGGWRPSGRGVFIERITVSPDARTFTSPASGTRRSTRRAAPSKAAGRRKDGA